MEHVGDHDGKSKTSSAADPKHYPATNNGESETHVGSYLPTWTEIAERAHQLWLQQGCPQGYADQNWQDAERELRTAALSRRLTDTVHEKAGSVQS